MSIFLKSLDPVMNMLGDKLSFAFSKADPEMNDTATINVINYSALDIKKTEINLITHKAIGYSLTQITSENDDIGDFHFKKISKFGESETLFFYDNDADKIKFLKSVEFEGGGGGSGVTEVALTGGTGLEVKGSPITDKGTFKLYLSQNLETFSSLSTSGLIGRNSKGACVTRTIESGSDNVTIDNGDGVDGNPKITVKGGGGTVTSVGIKTTENSGIEISGSPIEDNGNITLSLNNQLKGLGQLEMNGLLTRTSSGNYTSRTIESGSDNVTIDNGDGVNGNPKITVKGGGGDNITLSGAVIGEGSSNILTKLHDLQNLPYINMTYNWSKYETNGENSLIHLLNDSPDINLVRSFTYVIRAGAHPHSRMWFMQYSLGSINDHSCSLSLMLNNDGDIRQIAELQAPVDGDVSLAFTGTISASEPVANNDLTTKEYVDIRLSILSTYALFTLALGTITTNTNIGDHCPFDHISQRYDPLDLISLSDNPNYDNAVGVFSKGRVKLKAGYVYKITAFVAFRQTIAWYSFQIHDVTDAMTPIGINGGGRSSSNPAADSKDGPSIAYVNADTDRLVELTILSIDENASAARWSNGWDNYVGCRMDIQVIGIYDLTKV